MRVAIHTLGCKVNQYETAALEGALRARGHSLVPFDGVADAYIINTCTVTAVSDQKSRQSIRGARKRGPGSVVAVCGCYAQTDPQAVAALGVDLVSGTADRMKFIDDLETLAVARQGDGSSVSQDIETVPLSCEAPPYEPLVTVDDSMSRRVFEPLSADSPEGRTRAYLKVEDGCANFCSYCIIPYARGPVRSLPMADAVSEAKRLAAQGYRELVLTGIEISSWGRDLEGRPTLMDLIEAVCAAVPALRVRLGSLEPRTVTQDFCHRCAALENLCPHFHLSMQSGSDRVLRRMNRKYDTARYYESIKLLRVAYQDPGITTDLIVGFPGEGEAEFDETLAFLEQCAFTRVHVFPYSRRTGTPAAEAPDQVPKAIKEDRARRAAALTGRLEAEFLQQYVNQAVEVLFEDQRDGLWRGYTPNYVEVRAQGDALHNTCRTVQITQAQGTYLVGTL